MKQLKLTKEQIQTQTVWEPTGKSPGNTPQAKLQGAQLLLQVAGNPNLAPQAGIDVHALVGVLVNEGPLKNATNIQISKEQVEANAQAAQPVPGGMPPSGPPQNAPLPENVGGAPPAVSPIEGLQQILGGPGEVGPPPISGVGIAEPGAGQLP